MPRLELPSTSTSALVEQFLDAKCAKRLSPKTIATYRDRLTRFAHWLDDRPISRPELRAYLHHLQEQPQLSPTSAWSYFHDVGVFCAWLVEEELLVKNPALKLAPKKPKRLPASYTSAQLEKLLAVCDERDRAMLLTLLDTGLRSSEIVSLNRCQVDLASGHFTVIGKGNKERSGALGAYTLEAVQAYLELREDDEPALFLGVKGRLTRSGMFQIVTRRANQAGIRSELRRLVHGFRATFAKSYLVEGGDLETLRQLLGHESLVMAAHYAQLADRELLAKKHKINPLGGMLPDAR